MFDSDDWIDVLALGFLLLVTLLLFGLFAACGKPPSPSPELEAVIVEAVEAINEASAEAGGGALLQASGGVLTGPGLGGQTVTVTEDATPGQCGYYNAPRSAIGIALRARCSGSPALVHEIGHAFGLDHSPNPTSVMFTNDRVSWTAKQAANSLVQEIIAHDPGSFR